MEKALEYLIEQHKHCQDKLDFYSSPGNGAWAFANNYKDRLKQLDEAIVKLVTFEKAET